MRRAVGNQHRLRRYPFRLRDISRRCYVIRQITQINESLIVNGGKWFVKEVRSTRLATVVSCGVVERTRFQVRCDTATKVM